MTLQSLNYIAAMLLLVVNEDEEAAFWLLCGITEKVTEMRLSVVV